MFGLVPWRRGRTEKPVPWEASPFAMFGEEMNNLFNRFMERWPNADEEMFSRAWGLDVDETDKEVVIRAETPGFDAADFDVRVADNVLTIKAEHKAEEGKEGEKKFERYAKVNRSITLPPGTDFEKMAATYRNGILELKVPRKPEAVGRKIPVAA